MAKQTIIISPISNKKEIAIFLLFIALVGIGVLIYYLLKKDGMNTWSLAVAYIALLSALLGRNLFCYVCRVDIDEEYISIWYKSLFALKKEDVRSSIASVKVYNYKAKRRKQFLEIFVETPKRSFLSSNITVYNLLPTFKQWSFIDQQRVINAAKDNGIKIYYTPSIWDVKTRYNKTNVKDDK